MNRARVTGLIAICVTVAAPAAADVTLKQKVVAKGMMATSGDTVQFIKGARMRMDQTASGNQTSTILDVNAQQMTVLNHAKKEAEVYDMTKLGADLAKIPISDIKTSITPTKVTRQIAGNTCTVHDMQVSVPTTMGQEQLTFVLSGPMCLVKNGPGQADFAAFYKAASEKNLFFGDPRAAKAQAGQSKGLAAMHREMAALGVPLSQEMTVKFEGSGPMAAMMQKMGALNTTTTEVVAISTDAIPYSTFDVPEGYKVVKR